MMSVLTAMYLRGQKDLTYSQTGKNVRGKIQSATDFMYDTYDASKMSSEQLKELSQDKALDAIKDSFKPYIDKFKSFADDTGLSDAAKQGMKKIEETVDEYAPKAKELLERGTDKGRELINEGLEKLGIDLRVSVDINSNSTQLAGIVVDEISKNPQLRAEFVSNIVKSTKTFA